MIRTFYGVFLVVFTLGTIPAQAAPDQCIDEIGNLYPIPKGYKVILVPKWVKVKDLQLHRPVAVEIQKEQTQTTQCDNGQLVVSPAFCGD